MRNSRLVLPLFFVLALAAAFAAQDDQPKRAPSTPQERQRFVSLTRKLETSPLDKSLYDEKVWAKKWLEDVLTSM